MKRLPLIALAALPLTVGAVMAQQTANTQPSLRTQQPQLDQRTASPSQQGTPPTQSTTDYADVFVQKLAAQLGTTAAKLKAAAVAAGGITIDQAVKAGDLPSNRAAEMKRRLQDHPFAFGGRGRGGPGLRGDHDHRGPGGPRGQVSGPQGQAAPAAEDAATSGR